MRTGDGLSAEIIQYHEYVISGAEPQQAAFFVPLIIVVGLMFLAMMLFKPKTQSVMKDNRPSQATQRGAYVPWVMGRRRVGVVTAWVGDRTTTEEVIANAGGKSFRGDMPILMADGSLKPIEDIEVGDKVLSWHNPKWFKAWRKPRLVTDTVTRIGNRISECVRVAKASDGFKYYVTGEHPVMLDGYWCWIEDGHEGGKFKTFDDKEVTLEGFDHAITKPTKVYNFTTKKTHNYFVNNTLWHNLGGGEPPKQIIYWERGWSVLAIGPGAKLRGIYKAGALLPNTGSEEEPLNISLHPSGTLISCGDQKGAFRIYWGEEGQPIDEHLELATGESSRREHFLAVVWDRARLGTNPQWPLMEYDVECRHYGNETSEITAPDGVGNSRQWYHTASGEGVPALWAIYQVLTAPFPYGLAFPCEHFDLPASDEEFGKILNSEGYAVNLFAQDGQEGLQVLSEILQDSGSMFVENHSARYFIKAIRKIDTDVVTISDLGDDILQPPFDEIVRTQSVAKTDALVYVYSDAVLNFRNSTIEIDADGFSSDARRRKTTRIPIETVINRSQASKIANRRQLETLNTMSNLSIKGTRELRDVLCGDSFTIGSMGQCRVIEVKPEFDSPTIRMTVIPDLYSVTTYEFDDEGNSNPNPPNILCADEKIIPFELPWRLLFEAGATEQQLVTIIRQKCGTGVGAVIYFSIDGGSNYVGGTNQNQSSSMGGTLVEDWVPYHNDVIVENGPKILFSINAQVTDMQNNSSALDKWLHGFQLLLIGNEIMFVQRWEFFSSSEAGFTYVAKNVIRHRTDSIIEDHNASDYSFNVISENQVAHYDPFFETPNNDSFWKSVPFSGNSSMPIEDCPSMYLSHVPRRLKSQPIKWCVAGIADDNETTGSVLAQSDRRGAFVIDNQTASNVDQTIPSGTGDAIWCLEWSTSSNDESGITAGAQPVTSAHTTTAGNGSCKVRFYGWDPVAELMTLWKTVSISSTAGGGGDVSKYWNGTAAGTDKGVWHYREAVDTLQAAMPSPILDLPGENQWSEPGQEAYATVTWTEVGYMESAEFRVER